MAVSDQEGGFRDSEAEVSRRALVSLHAIAGTFGEMGAADIPSFRAMGFAEALTALAESQEATAGAKLDVLGALAKRGLPDFSANEDAYLGLAASIAGPSVEPVQVIADVKAAAIDKTSFATSATAANLPHHTTAFFMEDVCTTENVVVDGKGAVWVFSEFETDAPFETVAEWVNPVNWPARGPLMFKGMEPVGGQPVPIPGFFGADSWHGEFLETVQLVDRLETVLHCDYYRQGGLFAGMTYELTSSKDNQLDVDRGFLLVNDLGATRHVKALKIVGFTENVWDKVAMFVCPVWTDFVRGAAQGGTATTPLPPSSQPGTVGAVADWIEQMRQAASRYVAMADGWTRAVTSGPYDFDDLMRDGARFWLQVFRDWANASATAYTTLQQMAADTGPALQETAFGALLPPAGGRPAPAAASAAVMPLAPQTTPGPPLSGAEGTTIPVLGFDPQDSVQPSQLTHVESDAAVIPSHHVIATPTQLTANVYGIHVEANTTNRPPGLYIGELLIGGARRRAVQLYVSGAVKGDGAS
jgi:hypothetical protein